MQLLGAGSAATSNLQWAAAHTLFNSSITAAVTRKRSLFTSSVNRQFSAITSVCTGGGAAIISAKLSCVTGHAGADRSLSVAMMRGDAGSVDFRAANRLAKELRIGLYTLLPASCKSTLVQTAQMRLWARHHCVASSARALLLCRQRS